MKESIRVKLAISVWVVGVILLFVVASIVLTDMFRGNRDKEPLTQIELRLKNVADGMLSSDVEGVVISVVRRDGDVCSVACGTLLGENEPLVPGLGSLSYISGQMYGVERGDITLDSVIERYSMYDGSFRISSVELSNLAIMLLNGGVVGGERVLSNATIEEMMSHKLGWHQLSYSSLLGQESIEFCTSQGAMILNLEMGVAIAIGVDCREPLDDDEFEELRSKVASVVAALE